MSTHPVSPPASVEVRGVSRSFGATRALNRMDLILRPGRLTCLLGRNGAGKSTALRTILGLLRPDEGEVFIEGRSVAGADARPLLRGVGYLPEDPAPWGYLTGREYLAFVADLHGRGSGAHDRIEPGLRKLYLADDADALLGSRSLGTRKKVVLLGALLGNPRILLLDEPTTGLDPVAARAVKELLRSLRNRGCTVLFSTHVLELAEALADEVAILDRGRVLFHGTVEGLRGLLRADSGTPLEDLFLQLTTATDGTAAPGDPAGDRLRARPAGASRGTR